MHGYKLTPSIVIKLLVIKSFLKHLLSGLQDICCKSSLRPKLNVDESYELKARA